MASKISKNPLDLRNSGDDLIIAPSILSADFSVLAKEIKSVEAAGANWLHIDVMDGHFVPNLTVGAPVVRCLRPVTDLVLDCHLMVEDPARYIEDFSKAGADIITIHHEACDDLSSTIKLIQSKNIKAGVSLRPQTSWDQINSVLGQVDLVLVMSVNPGFGGQEFMPEVLEKVIALRREKEKKRYGYIIEIDGGISTKTIGLARKAGCQAFVAGSAIFKKDDYGQAIAALRKAALT